MEGGGAALSPGGRGELYIVGTLLRIPCKALNLSDLDTVAFSSGSPPGGGLLGGGGGGASSSESILSHAQIALLSLLHLHCAVGVDNNKVT